MDTVFISLLLLVFLNISLSNNLIFESIPSPFDDPTGCGRASILSTGGKSSAICDYDFLLNDKEKDVLEGLLNSLSVETNSNYGGAIAIQRKYDRRYLTITEGSVEEYTEAFANHLFLRWKLKSSDFLILLVIEDRQIYITSGSEMQKVLNMQQLESIIRNVAPLLKDLNYSDALKNLVLQIKMIVSPDIDNSINDNSEATNDNTERNIDNRLSGDTIIHNDVSNEAVETKSRTYSDNNTKPLLSSSPPQETVAPSSTTLSSQSAKIIITEENKTIKKYTFRRVTMAALYLSTGLYGIYKYVKYKLDIYINVTPAIEYDDLDDSSFNSTFPFKCENCNNNFGNFSSYKNFQISTRATKTLAAKDTNTPILMKCGHIFCLSCILLDGMEQMCPICCSKFDDNNNSNDENRRYITFADDIKTISFNNTPVKSFKDSNSPNNNPNQTLTPSSEHNNRPPASDIIQNQIRSKKSAETLSSTSFTKSLSVSGSMGSFPRPPSFHHINSTSDNSNNNNKETSKGTGGSW